MTASRKRDSYVQTPLVSSFVDRGSLKEPQVPRREDSRYIQQNENDDLCSYRCTLSIRKSQLNIGLGYKRQPP